MSWDCRQCRSPKNICGYGVYFQIDSYGFFADCAVDCESSNHIKDGGEALFYNVLLEKNVHIIDTTPNNLSIVFSPPDPLVYINGIEWNQNAEITFGISDKTRKVKINSTGMVEIE